MNPKFLASRFLKAHLLAMALCLFLSPSQAWAEGSDTVPLNSKTKASKTDRDTLDEQETPVPMVPGVPTKKRKPVTKNDVVSGLKDSKKEEAAEAEVAATEPGAVFIAGIDVYGTGQFTEVDLKQLFGKDLDRWVDMGMKKGEEDAAFALQNKLAEKAKKKWDLAFSEWSLSQFFTPQGLAVYLTLDVVEKKDVARRMSFLPEPKQTFPDPGGLLEQWRKYEEIALEMVEGGELVPDSERCVAFHCPFGHSNPKLKPFEKIFVDGAKKNFKALFAILKNDQRPEMRAAAAFVLPYYTNGKEIVEAMVERIPDPDVIVRNNVLRVLGDIAEFHKDLHVPLEPVVKAFDYPRVSDRAKALAVVFQLASQSAAVRESLRKTSAPQLVSILASKQPDHRELAHGILRKISGRDLAADDTKSWQRWVKTVQKDEAISRK